MDPIEVVTLARFNLRVCQQSLLLIRGAPAAPGSMRCTFTDEVIRGMEGRLCRALDLLWAAQEAAGLN
jgi:hypothetical protein